MTENGIIHSELLTQHITMAIKVIKTADKSVEVFDAAKNKNYLIPIDDLMYKDEHLYPKRPYKKMQIIFEGCSVLYEDDEFIEVRPPLLLDKNNVAVFTSNVINLLKTIVPKTYHKYVDDAQRLIRMDDTKDESCLPMLNTSLYSVLSSMDIPNTSSKKEKHDKYGSDDEEDNLVSRIVLNVLDTLQWFYDKMGMYNRVKRACRKCNNQTEFTSKEMKCILNAFASYEKMIENPYIILIENRQGGTKVRFDLLDRLAVVHKVPLRLRTIANIRHKISQIMDMDGHVCVPKTELSGATYALMKHRHSDITKLYVDNILEETCKEKGQIRRQIITIPGENGIEYTYLRHAYDIEYQTARILADLICRKRKHSNDLTEDRLQDAIDSLETTEMKLNPKQKHAIWKVFMEENVFVITGYPGSGKSRVSQYLRDIGIMLEAKLLVCAPTGKAAVRLGSDAMTIHRALECYITQDGFIDFHKGSSNFLDCDILIVDECSMVDTMLMYKLLSACNPNKIKIVFVGDKEQLPSVSYGCVLSSMLRSGVVPNVELTKIYRQGKGSAICRLAKMISTGGVTRQILEEHEEIAWLDIKNPEHRQEMIVKLFNQHKNENLQVLSPGKKGIMGTKHLNWLLHNDVFPMSLDRICVNDKVVCVKNQYTRSDETQDIDISKSAFNGEIGYIKKITYEPKSNTIKECMITFDVDKTLCLGENLTELAYCLTVHKSQGSEYDVVILILDEQHGFLLNRELFYTGVTRSKKKLYIISNDQCILKSAKTPSPGRHSNLGFCLKEFVSKHH